MPRYAVGTPGGVVVVDGDARRTIPGTLDVEFFAWDRDGASFVATVKTALVRIGAEDGAREVLVSDLLNVRFPDVDPATGRIAYSVGTEDPSRGWELWVCDANGSNSRSLGPGYGPSFSPDGFVWFEDYNDAGVRLFSVDPDGEAPRQHAFEDQSRRHTVVCSEDGKYLAWSEGGRLFLRDRAGRVSSPSPEDGGYDRFPSFAPDGRLVLFFRSVEGRESIVAHDVSSGESWELEHLTPGNLASFAPQAPERGRASSNCDSGK